MKIIAVGFKNIEDWLCLAEGNKAMNSLLENVTIFTSYIHNSNYTIPSWKGSCNPSNIPSVSWEILIHHKDFIPNLKVSPVLGWANWASPGILEFRKIECKERDEKS